MELDAMPGARPIARRRDADRATVVDLQARRGPELLGLARRLGLTAEEGEDAVQETLLRAWVALDDGEPIRDIDAWAFRTLYRICMDRHRLRRRIRLLADRLRPVEHAGSDEAIAERLTLWNLVDRLPERQRAVIYLRFRVDLTFEQIGEALDIRPVSARSHASRALDRLGEMVREEGTR